MAAIVKIPDLLQIALFPKEVNFNLLNLALQAIVYHLDLGDMKVQFNGEDSNKIQAIINESSNEAIKSTPLIVIPEAEESEEIEEELEEPFNEEIQEELVEEEPQNMALEDETESPTTSAIENVKKILKPNPEISEEIVIIESGKIVEPLKKRQPVTSASFARLEGKVLAIQAQLESMSVHFFPSDETLLEATRSQPEAEPIRDLLQGLNISKRMSGAEEGIDKLASLLETMAKEYATLKLIIDKLEDELGQNIVKTMKDIKNAAEYSRRIRPRVELFSKPFDDQTTEKNWAKGGDNTLDDVGIITGKETDETKYPERKTKSKFYSQGNESAKQSIENTTDPRMDQFLSEHKYIIRNLEFLNAELNTLADYIDAIITKIDSVATPDSFMDKVKEVHRREKENKVKETEKSFDECKEIIPLEERVACLEIKFSNNDQKIKRQLASFCERTNSISVRINDLEDSISTLFQNLSVVIKFQGHSVNKPNKKLMKSIAGVLKKFHAFQTDLRHVKYLLKTQLQLNKQEGNAMQECLRQVEGLKKVKADKYEIDEYLSMKADCDMLKLKVSYEEFELVCNDFARGIEDTLSKVSTQEDLIKMILNEVHTALQKKCDQEDIENLRDEFVKKLETIKNYMTHTSAENQGRVAAAAKQKLNVMNCVSCDREVFMKANEEIPAVPAIAELPPSRSIQPFVAYQLEKLRQLMIRNPNERSLFIFEEAVKRYRIKPFDTEQNAIYITGVKSRYCGGKHTTLKKTKLDCTQNKEAKSEGTASVEISIN